MYECACVWCVHVWVSEDNLQKSVLFFYHLGPVDSTKVVRLVDKWLYPHIHLSGLSVIFFLVQDRLIFCYSEPCPQYSLHSSGFVGN